MGFVKRDINLENYLNEEKFSFSLVDGKKYVELQGIINEFNSFELMDSQKIPDVFDVYILNVEQHGRKTAAFGYQIYNLTRDAIRQINLITDCLIIDSDYNFLVEILDREISISFN